MILLLGFIRGLPLKIEKLIWNIYLLISPVIIFSPCIVVPIFFSFCVGVWFADVVEMDSIETSRKIFEFSTRWFAEPWWRSHWFWCWVSRARFTDLVQLWTGWTWTRTPVGTWRTAPFGTTWRITTDTSGGFGFFRFSLYFSPSHFSWFFSLCLLLFVT